jgi:hypothetical protein
MEPAYVIAFSVMFTLLFFMVGSIIGWLTYRHLLETRPPYLHPEFFDENGQIIPDEVVAVRFEEGYFDDDDDDEDDEDD